MSSIQNSLNSTIGALTTAGPVTTSSSGVLSSSASLSIANGGTNATSMTNTDGVVYYDGTRLVTTAVGTSTYVLTSNGTGVAPTFQAASGGGVSSLTGTANQITASASTGAVTLSITTNPTLPGTTTTSGLTSAGTVNINTTGSGVSTIGTGGTGAVAIGNATGNTAVTGTLTTSGNLTVTAGGLTVTAGTTTLSALTTAGIVVTTSSGVLSSSTASINLWSDQTSGTVALLSGQGFVANKTTLTTLTLPSTSAEGDIIAVVGKGTGGWKIAQNAGNQIFFGSASSTSGTGGSVASTLQYDCVELICLTASANWLVRSAVGNLTVT
jgi:hypothetical protein